MKINKDTKYKLLIKKIKRIIEIINSKEPLEEDVYESVVDFIFVIEFLFKKRIEIKNKLLIYDYSKLKIDDIFTIIKGTNVNKDLHTIQISQALTIYIKFYKNSKLTKQGESLEILMFNRNQIEHGLNIKNMQSKKELLTILNNILPAFLLEAEKVLGTLPSVKINKENIQSEKEIQKIYNDLVLAKIRNYNNNYTQLKTGILGVNNDYNGILDINNCNNILSNENINLSSNILFNNINYDICPRCQSNSFSRLLPSLYSFKFSDLPNLYYCTNCNLELTTLEYEAVKRLRKEGKIINNPRTFEWPKV